MKLSAKCRMEDRGNTATTDIDMERSNDADDERKPERVAIDRSDDRADGPDVFADRPRLHPGIPSDAGLHGHEGAGDDDDHGDAGSPGPLHERDHGELSRYDVGIAEIRNRATLGGEPVARRIRGDGRAQVILALRSPTAREPGVETQRSPEPLQISGDHAGLLPGRAPASIPPIASENCCQTARRCASARSPRRVNE